MGPLRIVDRVDQLDFSVTDLPERTAGREILLADPAGFDIAYVINPHMQGNLHDVDHAEAVRQWEAMAAVYRDLGFAVHVIDAADGLPDLVFAANQSFPLTRPDGAKVAVLSHMAHPERHGEVPLFADWYRAHGYELIDLGEELELWFEGMGDTLWVPGRRLILGGYGFRTHPGSYIQLAEAVDLAVVRLQLVDPRFYHLDTCVQVLDARTALVVEEALEPEGLELLRALFPRVIAVPTGEGVHLLACNGYCPDERHYLVQRGATETARRVAGAGFEVIEIETGEYLKSGGSVYCMKTHLP